MYHHHRKSLRTVLAGMLLLVPVLAGCGRSPATTGPTMEAQVAATPSDLPLTGTEVPAPTSDALTPSAAVPAERTPTPTPDLTATALAPPPPTRRPTATSTREPPAAAKPLPIPLLPPGQPVTLTRIYMLDAKTGWAIGGLANEDQHVLRTADGGRTWQDVTPPELASVLLDPDFWLPGKEAFGYFLNAETAWVVYARGSVERDYFGMDHVWRTRDGGQTWEGSWFAQRGHDVQGRTGPPFMTFVDPQHGWLQHMNWIIMGSYASELFRTTDGGETWEFVPAENLNTNSGIDFIDPRTGWVALFDHFGLEVSLARTSDGGLTWERQPVPLPDGTLEIGGSDPSYRRCYIYAPALRSPQSGTVIVNCNVLDVGMREFLYVTEDGAQTWQVLPLPGAGVKFLTPNVGWSLGRAARETPEAGASEAWVLYKTSDGGRTWTRVSTVNWAGALHFVSERIGWAVTDVGEETQLLHTADGGRTWEQLDPVISTATGDQPRAIPLTLTLPAVLSPLEPGDVSALQVLAEVPAENATDLVFSSANNTLFVAHADGRVTLWDLLGEEYPKVMPRHADWIYEVELSPGDEILASASKDGTLKWWNWRIYQEQTALRTDAEVTSVAFSTGGLFASGSADQTVRLWDSVYDWYATTTPHSRLVGHTDWVWDVAYAPDGRTLASASADGTVRLWDVTAKESVHTLRGHTATVWRVAFSPDGQTLASGSWDGTLKLWDPATGQERGTLRGHTDRVSDVAFAPHGRLLASASHDGTVMLWDPASGTALRTLPEYGAAVQAVAFSPDGLLLATVAADGRLRLWGVGA